MEAGSHIRSLNLLIKSAKSGPGFIEMLRKGASEPSLVMELP